MDDQNNIVLTIDKLADWVERNWKQIGMPSRVARHLVDNLDRTATVLEHDADEPYMRDFDEDSVDERDLDEPYMDHYDDGVLQHDADEPYMQHFADEQDRLAAIRNVMQRESDVLEHDMDEDYMGMFNDDVLERQPDEPYMDEMDDADDNEAVMREHMSPAPVRKSQKKRAAKVVNDYEVEHHGVSNPSYFRGCATARSGWQDVASGVGWTRYEAVESALDMLADGGWDVQNIRNRADDRKTVEDVLREEDLSERDLEAALADSYFYVCVYVE